MFLTSIEDLRDNNYHTKQDNNDITDNIIDQQYADDIGFIRKKYIKKAMKNIALICKEKNLTIRETKTMQHIINRTQKMIERCVNSLKHYLTLKLT